MMRLTQPWGFALICLLLVVAEGRDCYLQCDELQITYDKQLCFDNCDQKIIIGVTVGSFCGICLIACFICYCRYRTFTCIYFLRERLKKQFNHVDRGRYTIDQYKKQAQLLFKSLKKAETINNFYFQFKKKKETMTIQDQSFKVLQQNDYLTSFSFNGKDSYSDFVIEGYFLYRDGNPFVWFFKRYVHYQLAIQQGMKEIIIFQSINMNEQALTGCWYDSKQEDEQGQSIKGKWSLIMKFVGISNRLEEVTFDTQLY